MTTDETQLPTVIRPRRSQRDVLFGFLIAIIAFAILRGLLAGGDRSTATTVILIVLAIVLVVFLVGWISIIRRPTLLEVGPDTIRLTRAGAKKEEPPISRAFGNQLAFGIGGTARARFLTLRNAGGGPVLSLQFFDKNEVATACANHGWSVV